MIIKMGLDNSIGLMAHILKAILKMGVKNQENLFGLIEMSTKGSLLVINLKEKVNLHGKITSLTKVHGRKILCMDMEFLYGKMAKYLKGITNVRKNMEKDS